MLLCPPNVTCRAPAMPCRFTLCHAAVLCNANAKCRVLIEHGSCCIPHADQAQAAHFLERTAGAFPWEWVAACESARPTKAAMMAVLGRVSCLPALGHDCLLLPTFCVHAKLQRDRTRAPGTAEKRPDTAAESPARRQTHQEQPLDWRPSLRPKVVRPAKHACILYISACLCRRALWRLQRGTRCHKSSSCL